MAYQVVTILPSALRTASGNASVLSADTGDTLALQLDVTTQQGTTPTLDVSIQWSMDGTTWSVVEPTPDAFTQVTTTLVSRVRTFQVKGPHYRVVWAIGGTVTPGYTFSIRSYETT